MKRFAASLIFALAFLSLAIAPAQANAAFFSGHIVPDQCHCDNQTIQGGSGTVNSAPDWGCVLATVQNLVNFFVTLAMVLTTLYLVLTGFAFITSGGSSEARSKAKTRFTNVFVGLAVLLASWLIVDFVMKQLYDQKNYGPWNSILAGTGNDKCIVVRNPESISSNTLTNIVNSTGTTGATTGSGGTVSGSNGNTKLNAPTASSYAISHALSSSSNSCAFAVRKALAAGGLTSLDTNHPTDAYQYGPRLTNLGFSQIYSGTYSASSESLSGIQVGDVVVFQPVKGHSSGHIAIYTSSGWVSDYRQSRMSSNAADYAGGSFAIYRP